MKHYKKWLAILLTFSLAAVLLSGCQFHMSFGIGDFVTGESYPDAARYQTGAFTYDADQVNSIEIYWRSGEVEIEESDSAELSVRESGGTLSEETAMHYLLEDGILRVRFCKSDVNIRVDPNDKRLTIQVPRGIDLSVHTTSAPVKAGNLTQNTILVSAHSGSTDLGTVEADNLDFSSSSGAIHVDSITAQTLECDTTSGSVHIGAIDADAIEVDSTSGSVDLGLSAASQVEVHTTSGKTTLRLPEGGAEVAFSATSGTLHTDAAYERKGDLFVFGRGESQISVESTSGNLSIQAE